MSDILTIDTSVAAGLKKAEPKVEPLQVFDDRLPMLSEVMPEFVGTLPNASMTHLTKRMKMTMKLYSGLGLSANQCGVKERVFVIGTDQFQMACINPKVISVSEELVKDTEGCLSFPAFFLNFPRPSWVEVEFTDENGETKQVKLDGLTARCFLHELDHLNGVKFTSYVGQASILQAARKQQKLIKKIVRRKNEKS
jgi:peptide deformylase